MNATDLYLLRFLLASLGCLAAGCSVWALGATLRRYLPALAAQRSMWLLGQLTVLATFLLILLPQQERVRLLPPIEAATESVAQYIAPAVPAAASLAAPSPGESGGERSWLAIAAQAWVAVYALGLAFSLVRLVLAQRALNALARDGVQLTALARHEGFDPANAPLAQVIEVDAPIAPMLLGPFKPRLLLPRHLRSFDATQQRLIVAHELTHLRRHDLHWMVAGLALQTLLWFNPFMRSLRDNLAWAQELGCDQQVLQGRPAAQRKAYAAALVGQLKLQHCAMNTALAFGGVDENSLAARVSLIRTPAHAAQGWWARGAMLAGLAVVALANFALQPALAWNVEPAQAPIRCTELADPASGATLMRVGQCDTRVTPASTFNIAVSLMGYDTGFLIDEQAPKLPFREGYPSWIAAWRQDMGPRDWIKYSAVWYAQQVTAQVGAARFQRYLDGFGYGNRDAAGDAGKANDLSLSWLNSSLKISADEQVAFLSRIVNRQLPVSARAHDMTGRIMNTYALPNGWQVYGKTGTGSPVKPNGKDDQAHSYGWFVGWVTNGQRTIVFAHLVQDQKEETEAAGPRARDAFLRDLPAKLASL